MKKLCIFLFVVVFLLSGCTLQNLKSPTDMSAKELSTWAMGIYNAQYDNYEMLAGQITLTEEHKVILRKKKTIMVELWPYLKLYTTYVDSGAIPTAEIESKVISLIDRLIMETIN